MDTEKMKQAAGYKAASFIEDDMIIGLGTGSTAKYFIEKVIARKKEEGLKIQAVATSNQSLKQALEGNIPILDINSIESIDLTVDGADEIDPQKRMIKGGGGALLREKIIASMSKELVIVVDEKKLSKQLGSCKLPVEITPFACNATLKHIQKLGVFAQIRTSNEKSNDYYITDNGNYIVDIRFKEPIDQPEKQEDLLKAIPGIVETGFFFHLAGRVITAFTDGQILIT